jgi:hypothetical protein
MIIIDFNLISRCRVPPQVIEATKLRARSIARESSGHRMGRGTPRSTTQQDISSRRQVLRSAICPACGHAFLNRAAGESHLDKIQRLREELTKKKCQAMVVTMLDEVAWLFNMRGSDIEYNPGVYACLIL